MPTYKLLLLTSSYPDINAKERPFVLPEIIGFVQNGFDVTIMPAHQPATIDSVLPEAVVLDTSYAQSYKFSGLVIGVLSALLAKETWNELVERPAQLRRWRFWKEAIRLQNAKRVFASGLSEFDLAYTFWFTADTIGLAALSNIPVVTRAHGYDVYEELPENSGHIPFRRAYVPAIRKVIALADEGNSYLRERFGFSLDQVSTLALGVARQESAPLPDERELVLVSCSFPSLNKRIGEIRKLAVALARARPDKRIHWHHIGARAKDIPMDNGEDTPTNFMASAHGKLTQEQILQFYKQTPVSLFVNLSLSEGTPVSIMEAMSFGIPILAPAVGGIPEMLREGGGLLVPDGITGDQALHYVHTLTREPDWRQRIGAEAQAAQRRLFDTETNRRQLALEMLSLCKGTAIMQDRDGGEPIGSAETA